MKIKYDFVTNSSSTGFIFIFKGSKNNLYKAMINHKDKFKLYYKSYYIKGEFKSDVWDIIDSIDPHIKKIKEFRKNKRLNKDTYKMRIIKPIEDLISEFKNDINSCQDLNLDHSIIREIERNLKKIKNAKNKGLNNYLDIDFGNDGLISKKPLSITMDVVGREIEIDSNNLVVITEQRR